MMSGDNKEIFKTITKKILLELFNATVVVGSFLEDRRDPIVFKEFVKYEKWKNFKRCQFNNRLDYLLGQKLILKTPCLDGQEGIILSEKGLKKALKIKFDPHLDDFPNKWDRKWRLIVFDVDEINHHLRNIFRNILKSWGFEPIQKSVFIFPFECKKEIHLARKALQIKGCVKYMLVERLEGQEELIKKFMEKRVLSKSQLKYE